MKGNLSWLRVLQTVCNLYVYFYFIIIIRDEFEFDDLKYCVLISVLRFTNPSESFVAFDKQKLI